MISYFHKVIIHSISISQDACNVIFRPSLVGYVKAGSRSVCKSSKAIQRQGNLYLLRPKVPPQVSLLSSGTDTIVNTSLFKVIKLSKASDLL